MYTSRAFWRDVALTKVTDQSIIEDRGKYIVEHRPGDPNSYTLSFLQFDSDSDFKETFPKIRAEAKSLGKTQIWMMYRRSDPVDLEDETLTTHGGKRLVELSLCGSEVNQAFVDQLSDQSLPEGFMIRNVSFPEIADSDELYQMIFDNFVEGFAPSPGYIQKMFASGNHRSKKEGSTRLYHIIHDDSGVLAGFSHTVYDNKGPLKNTMHLGMAVTDSKHRRKGLYKNLLKARFTYALENGYKYAYTESDVTTSRPILEKLGLKEFDGVIIFQFDV